VHSNVPWRHCFHLYREAFKTATDLDGLLMVTVNGKRVTCYQHMFGINPQWTKHMRLFGEAGTVKLATGTSPKLADRGVQCMMVGCAENHNGNLYHMWNLVTEHAHVTHNLICMKKMMPQKIVEEDKAQMLPDVEAAIMEWRIQEVLAPQEEPEPEVESVGGQETSDNEEEDEEHVPHVDEQTQRVTATTRYS